MNLRTLTPSVVCALLSNAFNKWKSGTTAPSCGGAPLRAEWHNSNVLRDSHHIHEDIKRPNQKMHLPQQLRVSPSLLFQNGCGQEQCVSVSMCSLVCYLFTTFLQTV